MASVLKGKYDEMVQDLRAVATLPRADVCIYQGNSKHASRVLPWSERFFKRHGAKTIFFGRFFAVLRVTAAWLAGISRMHWWQFFIWNAAGGICWAVLVGLVSYYLGRAAAEAINRYGLIAGVAIVALLVLGALVFRFIRRRMMEAEPEA